MAGHHGVRNVAVLGHRDAPDPSQPLEGRNAFVGKSTGYPALKSLKLDLGTKLAGKTIRVRFRIGTDAAAGVEGWDIDNIAFAGITNKPFASVVTNTGVCNAVPVDAGTDAATTSDAATSDDGGGSSTGGASTGGASTGGTKPPPVYSPVRDAEGESNCSCTTAVGHSTRSGGMALMALGGLALVVSRRRRRSHTAL